MFSSFLRPSRSHRRRSRLDRPASESSNRHRDFSSISRTFHASPRRGNDSTDDGTITQEDEDNDDDDDDEFDEDEDQDEDADDNTPLLPIFSSQHLDAIPVFQLTHVFRELVVARCETVLSWDQLRAPQVTQFLLKPVQSDIIQNHLNAGTMYALFANCLQFQKEATLYPGNSGTSNTRAMICELLAIRLLREYSTRELIDALCYDFDPFQGQADQPPAPVGGIRQNVPLRRPPSRVARVSCYEISLRAQAKRFLAHPMVVQQLEAIWAGTIVFHSAADSMHRKLPLLRAHRTYGTNVDPKLTSNALLNEASMRRAVTIYNPRDASLFKLSRLRVPRYRNVLSTLSFAGLLALFVAVLVERSLEITNLEIVFWLWSAGYMLDEIVGFNEQGFSLYIASFWNTFDLGILAILFVHLCLRIYGIIMPDDRKHTIANTAYDVLAADAILLFPRLFSVLDHYKYFSQLLIAFRMMSQDLVAIFLLILISCSGFFVALSLSFGHDTLDTPSSVAYALLQILMGFTPAAWDRWDQYTTLGKMILTLFLFICHFLVVTILITVLTNSFMAIVRNANEEHQFVFAVNTISNVKSDALFSYVAPANILQWVLTPLRYFIPFRQYVKVNRTIIKLTHFPILFTIYLYERTILRSNIYESLDLVERGRPKRLMVSKLPRLVREPSIATFRQDRALEAVFEQPADATLRTMRPGNERRKTSAVVNNWMKDLNNDVTSPPLEQDRKIVDRLERRQLSSRYLRPATSRARNFTRRTMSVASDPEEFMTNADLLSPIRTPLQDQITPSQIEGPSQHTDADGDDELHTDEHEDDEQMTSDRASHSQLHVETSQDHVLKPIDYFTRRSTPLTRTPEAPRSLVSGIQPKSQVDSGVDTPSRSSMKREARQHLRNVSSATMIYKPTETVTDSGNPMPVARESKPSQPSGAVSPQNKSNSSGAGAKTPKRQARVRPIMPKKDDPAFRSAPDVTGILGMKPTGRQERPRRTTLEMDLVSDIGDNKAIGGGYVGAIPASFATQMFQSSTTRQNQERKEEQERFSRLMMARMNSLEEGFREVIHEMRETMGGSRSSRAQSPIRVPRPAQREKRVREVEKGKTAPGSPIGEMSGKENLDPRHGARADAPDPFVAVESEAKFGGGTRSEGN